MEEVKEKAPQPLIAASLINKGNRMVYEYRIRHLDWNEQANVSSHWGPFSFINLQYKVYPGHHFFPSHSHNLFEIYAVIRGKVTISTGPKGDTQVELKPGTAILNAPRQFHSAQSERPASVINIHFKAKLPPARRLALARLSGRRIRLGGKARSALAALKILRSVKSKSRSNRIIKAAFCAVMDSLCLSRCK